jgi:PKD repeat protein
MKKLNAFNGNVVMVFLFVFALTLMPGSLRAQTILPVTEIEQLMDEWCWVGVSKSVMDYYGSVYEQCEIAEYTRTHSTFHDFGPVDCCLDPNQGCNYWNYNYSPDEGSIKMILIDMGGIDNYGVNTTLSQSEVNAEISAGRPFIIRVCCVGHFIVGRGWDDSNDTLYYMDPWFGEGYGFQPYSTNVNGRNWTHTNVITTDPVASCSTPGGISATNISDTGATLSWTAVGLANSYDYRYKATASGTWLTGNTASTSVALSGLTGSTEYEFQVRSSCTGETSSYSSSYLFTTAQTPAPPTAAFTADTTNIETGQSVSFTDQSTGVPNSWSWSFPGGTPSSSATQHPTVTYNSQGSFDVTLTVSNGLGNDSEVKSGYINVTAPLPTVGNTQVFSTTTWNANRRAVPYTMPETGTIYSITQYHDGGGDSMILAVYDGESAPANRIGVTAATTVSATTGWQTINLVNPVAVAGGSTIWLAWVYENNPNVYYQSGTPGRVDAGEAWAGGMPTSFGSASEAAYIYSIYCSYSPSGITQYTLTTNVSGQGSVSPSGGTYNSGTVVSLTATPDSGWEFSGWSGDLSGSANPANITMNANKTVTATFTEIPVQQYTLTVNVTGQGSVGLSPSGGVYDSGTVVTLTPNPDAGWQFSGWSGDLSGSDNPETITMNTDKTVSAAFTEVGGTETVGYTSVFGSSTTAAYRRASPYTMPETGTLSSITIYHNGGSGDMILGIYDGSGAPANRIAVTDTTAVNSSGGWQTVDLTSTAVAAGGSTVWLAWVFESNPGIRYRSGSPGRYDAGVGWSGGMPATFGSGTQGSYEYSIYATYTPGGTPPPPPPPPSGYCASTGQNSATYIDNVEFGSFTNSSGAAGYSDFTNLTVNMTAGGSVSWRIDKGDSTSSGFHVWIDFNGDGDFDDSGEEVVRTGMWNNYANGSFNVPSGLNLTTRMRVTVKRNNYASACETFSYGEVEDYTVVIQ